MVNLPISGVEARWRTCHGEDGVTLAASRPGLGGVVAYLAGGVVDAGGVPLDPANLPIGDIDVLVLSRRRDVRGDVFVAEGRCEHCGVAVDLRFSLSDYASHRRPRRPRGVTPAEEAGWWRLNRPEISFREPLASDVVTIMSSPRPRADLLAPGVSRSVCVLSAPPVQGRVGAISPT